MFASQVHEYNDARGVANSSLSELAFCLDFSIKFRDASGVSFRSGPILGTTFTLPEAIVYAQRALNGFKNLKIDKNSPAPRPAWAAMQQAIGDISNQVSTIKSLSRNVSDDDQPKNLLNGATIVIAANGGSLADFSSAAQSLVSASDRLVESVATLASALGVSRTSRDQHENPLIVDDAVGTLAALSSSEEAARAAIAAREASVAAAGEVAAIKDRAKKELAAGQEAISTQQAALAAAQTLLANASTTATENAATTQSKLDEVTRLTAQAEVAHGSLTAYAATLDATERRVKATEARADDVVSSMESNNGLVAALIAEAEKMVSGATVAGLATAFATERSSLEISMRWAYGGFLVGIVIMTLLSSVVAAYVLNIPINLLGLHIGAQVKGPNGYEITIAGVISRALILVAPFWLTLFSARRYRSLFDLRQQYSHKYNMAFSMEGFKNQAPDHKEAIAAWVFSIVAASPLLQRQGTSMEEPPPHAVNDLVAGATETLTNIMKGK